MHIKRCHISTSIIALLLTLAAIANVQAQPLFSKTFSPDTIGPGSIATLTFDINNTDPVNPVTDLAFTDTLPAGMTIADPAAIVTDCVNGLVTAPTGGGTISFTDARLSSNAACTVSVNVTASTPGILMNVSGDLTSSQGNSGTAADDLTVDIDRPGFSKSFSPSMINFGDRSTLTFTIDNSQNPGQQFSLSFADNLPTGMLVADPANTSTTCGGGVITAQPGSNTISYGPAFPGNASIAAGATCTISADVRGMAVGMLGNTSGNLTSTSPGTFEDSGMAGATLQVNSGTELQLLKQFNGDPVPAGSTISLAFNLSNLDRNFTASNISFTDDLDAALSGLVAVGLPLTDVCGTGSALTGSSVLTLTGSTLPPEGNCIFSVDVQLPAGAAAGAYPNTTSTVTGDVGGTPVIGSPATDSLFVSDAPSLTKTFLNNPIGAGQPTTMEFTITNVSSTSMATDITFQDNLSAFLSGVTVTALPANGFCGAGSMAFTFPSNGQTFLQISGANLAAGASCTFAVDLLTQAGTPDGDYLNITSAISGTVDGMTQQGQTASDTLTVVSAPSLSKSFTDDPVMPGETVTLEFTISHALDAPADATDITFSDDLDATLSGLVATGLPVADICGSGSQLSGTSTLSLTGGTLSPDSDCTFSVTLQVPAGALPGSYLNTTSELSATVLGVTATEPATSDELQIGGLQFSKSFTDDPVLPGGIVTLEFTIDNSSTSSDATDMFFTDNLASVVSGLSAVAPLPAEPCGAGSSIIGTTFLIFIGGNLLAGESCTFSVSLQVPAAAPDGSFGNFTSNLNATFGGSVVSVPPASDFLDINSNLLLLAKSFTDDPVMPGDTVSLEFTVSNQSTTDTVTGITFTDDLDATLSGLQAIGLPVSDVCGAGSQLSGTSVLTLTGGNLPAAASCTFSATLQVPAGATPGDYPNTTSQVTGDVSGTPVNGNPAQDTLQLRVVDFSKAFINPVITGSSTTLTFTIQNLSSDMLDSLSFSDDLGAVYPGLMATGLPLSDVCGSGSQLNGTSLLTLSGGSLPPMGVCTFDVTVAVPAGGMPGIFTNTTSDLFTSGLSIATPAVADLEVIGIPALTITPPAIDFGDVLVGSSSASMDVSLSNSGNDDLNITTITPVAAPFMLTGTSCPSAPFTLTAGNGCTLSYTYNPSTTGAMQQLFSVSSNAASSPDSFALQGTGIQPELSLSPNPLDFGAQLIDTTSTAMSVLVSNTGSADLTVMTIDAASSPFADAGGNCAPAPFTLAAGVSCTLDYTFTPTVPGNSMQSISFTSDAPSSPDNLTLQGEATQAGLGLSAALLDFGDVTLNTTADLPLTLSNTGDGELTISAIGDPLAPFTVATGTCGAVPIVLAPMAQCQLDISFAPTATGSFMDAFDITSNAPTSPDTVNLMGNGALPVLELDVNAIDFGIQPLGTNETRDLTLSNTGDGDLTVTQITDPLAPFSVLPGDCGATPFTVTAGMQCQLQVQFSPMTSREFSSQFDILSNATDSPATVAVTGNGLLVEVPTLNQWMLLLLTVLLLLAGMHAVRINRMPE